MRVEQQIASHGKVNHARLGVTIQELNQSLAESFKLDKPDGALVASVMPGSPADKAGLQPGDVILQYNGQTIHRSGDLPTLVSLGTPGDKATLEVWRGGKKVTMTTTLTKADDGAVASNDASNGNAARGRLGVAVRPLTPEESREANLAGGVVVEQAGGAAARAGIEAGDVILAVNGTPVKTVAQLQSLIAKDSKHLALLILRGDSKIFVPVNLG
jgi:serine protease Do